MTRVLAWMLGPALLLGLLGSFNAAAQEDPTPYGVVSLRVTSQAFDPILPWNKRSERTLRGNALVVAGNRLLTTADLIRDANLIQVRKFARYPDYPARAVLVDYDLNLALLEVDDPEFWRGLVPLPISRTPLRSSRFLINRWRSNGRFQQGTGEVVDFLVSSSPFGLMEFPLMRASTAMGGLGWAEVLTAQGKVVGMITSHDDRQIRAINGDLIRLLVQAANQDFYRSFAHRGFAWQRLNQGHMRASLGLERTGTGVLIRRLFPGGTGAKSLRPMDILHKINGYDIDPEGLVQHPDYGLILFTMAFNESLAPTISVEIDREGRRMRLDLERRRFSEDDYRIHLPRFDTANDFEVFGGLVFQELSLSYLQAWGDDWRQKAPRRLVIEYSMNSLKDEGHPAEKVVIITRVLPDPANLGYQDINNAIVTRINSQPINSLAGLRQAIAQPRNGFHLIELLPGQGRGRLVFRTTLMDQVNTRVRERYGIPSR